MGRHRFDAPFELFDTGTLREALLALVAPTPPAPVRAPRRRPGPVPSPRRAEIAPVLRDAYVAGATIPSLMETYGLKKGTAFGWIFWADPDARERRQERRDVFTRAMRDRWRAGESIAKIAADVGVAGGTIYSRIRRLERDEWQAQREAAS